MGNEIQYSNQAKNDYKDESRPNKTILNKGLQILGNGFQFGKKNKELRTPIDGATHQIKVGTVRILYKIIMLPPTLTIGAGVTILGVTIEIVKIFSKKNHETTKKAKRK